MVRNFALAAVAAGGLGLTATAPASAANVAVSVNIGAGHAYGGVMPVYYRGYRRGPGWGYRGYYRRPAFGVYVAPRPRYYGYRAYSRCWINRRGYRVCSY